MSKWDIRTTVGMYKRKGLIYLNVRLNGTNNDKLLNSVSYLVFFRGLNMILPAPVVNVFALIVLHVILRK